MKKIAIVLATLVSLFATVSGAEAQRARGSLSGAEWGTYSFQSEQYPQARSYRGASRSIQSNRSISRSARASRSISRSTRANRTARRGGRTGSSSLELASLTGSSGAGPRPGAWCGWWMRTQLGGGPAYNLAWNWRNYGSHSSGPQVGAVVVWRHHVGMITGQASNGQWIVKSGNDGGRVRERARSVSGAIFRV